MNNNFADWNPLEENNESNNTTTNNTPLEPTNTVVLEQKSPSLEDTTEILGETMNIPVVNETPKSTDAPMVDPTLPNTRNVQSTIFNSDTRYNPVTGEEVKVQDVITAANQKNKKEEAPKVEEKQPEYKPTSTWNSILLFLFFVFLVAFVDFTVFVLFAVLKLVALSVRLIDGLLDFKTSLSLIPLPSSMLAELTLAMLKISTTNKVKIIIFLLMVTPRFFFCPLILDYL